MKKRKGEARDPSLGRETVTRESSLQLHSSPDLTRGWGRDGGGKERYLEREEETNEAEGKRRRKSGVKKKRESESRTQSHPLVVGAHSMPGFRLGEPRGKQGGQPHVPNVTGEGQRDVQQSAEEAEYRRRTEKRAQMPTLC